MAVEIADAYLALYTTMPGVKRDIEKNLASVDGKQAGAGLGRDMGSGLKGSLDQFAIGGAVAGVFAELTSQVTNSLQSLAGEAVTASDATDKFKGTLNFAGLDTSTIDSLTDSTRTYADETVYALADIQGITAQLAANGVDGYGDLAEAAGNLNAVAGGNADTFKSVGMALTQTAGAGKLTTENWNQLSDAIPGASGRLQEAMLAAGAFEGNFRDAMAKGEVSAEEFNAALLQLGSEPVAVEAAKSVTTFEGMIGNLQATIVGGFSDALTKMKPLIGDLVSSLTAGIDWLMPYLLAGVDSAVIWLYELGDAAKGVASILFQGDYTGGIFGLEEDSAIVDWLFELRGGVIAFGAAWTANDGDVTSSGFPGFMEAAAYSIRQLVDYVGQLDFSSWDGFVSSLGTGQPALASIGTSFETLAPAVGSFVSALPDMTGAVGTLAAAALPALAGALGFLADNVDTIIQWMPLIVAGFVAWRVASVVAKNAQVAIAPIMAINNGLILANSIVEWQAARATTASAAATTAEAGATNVSMFARVRATAALVANKVATLAASAATKAAAAAQWVLNAAMSANPIMLVVLAIAALVAGLVWFFTQTELGQEIWANFTTAIGAAWTWLWESVLSPVFVAIGGVFAWLYDNVITPIVAGIVLYVQMWAGIFTWLWENILAPVFAAIGEIFSWIYNNVVLPIVTGIVLLVQVWAAIITWIWTTVISVVFAAIGAIFTWLYDNVITPIVAGVVAYFQLWGEIFTWLYENVVSPVFAAVGAVFTWLYENIIKPVWSGIQSAIQVVGDWITNTLWPGIQSVIGFIASGFESMGSTIATVWDNIKKAAVAPINFVIQTVYNDGIKALFDDIAEAVGLDIRMPSASTIALATGGVLPGYTPGRDVHEFISPTAGRLLLSGGEAIMRPEFTAAIGRGGVDAFNAAARTGGVDGVRKLFGGGQEYADGGIWDDITGGIAGAASWIGDAVGNVAKIMTDPAGAIDSLIRTPVKALLESIGGGNFGSMVAEIPLKAIDGIAEWATANITPPAPSSGEWVGGNTLERLRPLIAKHGLMITDTYRDPAYNASVGGSPTSFHMDKDNPAVDVAGSFGAMDAFARDVAAVGGWRQILWQVAGHYDHVHVANRGGVFGDLPTYDSGGYLMPGVSTVYNGTGQPEPVFTSSQWAAIEDMANTGGGGMPSELAVYDVDGVLLGSMQVAAKTAVAANENGRRRALTGGGSSRV